jgi:hypothetical protein
VFEGELIVVRSVVVICCLLNSPSALLSGDVRLHQ